MFHSILLDTQQHTKGGGTLLLLLKILRVTSIDILLLSNPIIENKLSRSVLVINHKLKDLNSDAEVHVYTILRLYIYQFRSIRR